MNTFRELLASLRDHLSGRRTTVAAFLFYPALAMLLYGGVIAHPSTTYIGDGHDPAAYIWSMVWWPYAVSHRLNPFITRVIWTPSGFNLTWAAAIPGPSFILSPITRWLGPVVSFNTLMIFIPATVSWSTFLPCRRISGQFYPSLLGGYLFGFSPYMIGHMHMGQPNLTLIFGVPICLHLVLLRLDGAIGRIMFVAMLAIALALQFFVSTEIVALMTLFGGASLGLALLVLPMDQRLVVRRAIPLVALAYVVFAILVSPYLYYAFAYGVPEQMHPVEKCSADLLGYLVPSQMLLFGGGTFWRLSNTLTPHVWYTGKGIYANPALLVILLLYARRHWRTGAGKLLLLASLMVVVCSFGPYLHVANRPLLVLPWRWIMKVPTLNKALPVRFPMFFYLCISIMASIVLSERSIRRSFRTALAGLSVLLLLPSRHYIRTLPQQVDTPDFFNASILDAHVKRGDTLLILPFSIQGTSLLWQAQTDMYFNMVGGYVSTYVPEDFRRWPVVAMMLGDEPGPDLVNQLKPFLAHYQVKGIVLAPEAQPKWRGPISELGVDQEEVGGVLFYPIGGSAESTGRSGHEPGASLPRGLHQIDPIARGV